VTTPAAPLPDDLASAHAPDLILALRDTLADAKAAQSMPLFLAHSPVG